MRIASVHNNRNSSFIVDLAMGQIPRFTERISSFDFNFHFMQKCVLAFAANSILFICVLMLFACDNFY